MWLLWAVKKKKRRNVVNSEFGYRFWKIRPMGHYSPVLLHTARPMAGWLQGILSHYGTPSIWSNSATKVEMRRCVETAIGWMDY
jgi:hypothetical protein